MAVKKKGLAMLMPRIMIGVVILNLLFLFSELAFNVFSAF